MPLREYSLPRDSANLVISCDLGEPLACGVFCYSCELGGESQASRPWPHTRRQGGRLIPIFLLENRWTRQKIVTLSINGPQRRQSRLSTTAGHKASLDNFILCFLLAPRQGIFLRALLYMAPHPPCHLHQLVVWSPCPPKAGATAAGVCNPAPTSEPGQ